MSKLQELIKNNDLVRRAYDFAKKAHQGQKRKNGEPYFNHCLATAEAVLGWGLDEPTVAAALLHDVVEDTGIDLEKLKKDFGEEVAFLVDGVTKIGQVRYRGIEAKVENLRKFILYLSKDIRVLLVKLADRLNNMKTLYAVHPQKQKRIALETMEIYAPLAYRLGMQKLSGELEDLAFPYLYPAEYKWLLELSKEKYEERERYAEKFKPLITEELTKNEILILNIVSRAKRYTSLYKKLLRYDMNIESIYDLVALRVIVNSVEDCYAALGMIHKRWPPLPGRFKDYIALPKPNGYRSLHTTVFGPDKKIAEVQIRTQEMHDESENGIAAHFAYEHQKGTKAYADRRTSFAEKKELPWIQQLRNWQRDFTNPDDFLRVLKIDLFSDRILALTPKGEVLDLPSGATPVDFAYQVHSEIGNSCVGAKINGRIVSLNTELKSGDMVEILTQKNKKPSESWLKWVKTSAARNHIKSAVRDSVKPLFAKKPTKMEFRVVAEDRIGLLKDLSEIFSRSHINILELDAKDTGRLPIIKIVCPALVKEKAEKLLIKIKTIKEIKETGFRFL